jgi:hypothetical protein
VFYIVSAAVIGENPRLFGFSFDNPLAFLGDQSTREDTSRTAPPVRGKTAP